MNDKKDFKAITAQIKAESLSFGYGMIRFDKDKEDLWIDDYENHLGASIHVDAIEIDMDQIVLCEDGHGVMSFDHVYSIDRQIQIYDAIFDHKEQLKYYELDWDSYFKALLVSDESGKGIWRILSPDEARHLWFNGRAEICCLHQDGTESIIKDVKELNSCIENDYDIGVYIRA